MDSIFADRVVIITGGSAGIGRAAVELFARKGARVVLAARGAPRGHEVATRLQAEGCHVLFVQTDPLEAAQTVLWLCSSAASYVTGQSMIVDGGLTSWRARHRYFGTVTRCPPARIWITVNR